MAESHSITKQLNIRTWFSVVSLEPIAAWVIIAEMLLGLFQSAAITLRELAAIFYLTESTNQQDTSSDETENESVVINQFVRVPGNTECIEDYVVGGYHPIHIGDMFKNRYHILRKLGNGEYATVWLAKDERSVFINPSSIPS